MFLYRNEVAVMDILWRMRFAPPWHIRTLLARSGGHELCPTTFKRNKIEGDSRFQHASFYRQVIPFMSSLLNRVALSNLVTLLKALG